MIKNMTVYSHNLKRSDRSFASDLSVKDFTGSLQWDMVKASKVTYVNPKGESKVILVNVVKRGIYDID